MSHLSFQQEWGKVCFRRCVCYSPNKYIPLVGPKKTLRILRFGPIFAETGVAMATKTEIIVCADFTYIMPFLIMKALRRCFKQSLKKE